MSKAIIIYGSTGGNTQSVAERIDKILKEAGKDVTVKNVTNATPEDLTTYDVILLGSSTWNEGELQDDFVPYHMQLEENPPALSGKKSAVFGCGESIYEHFCQAVDVLENSLSKWGTEKLVDGLKIDGYPEEDENITKIEDWAKNLATKF